MNHHAHIAAASLAMAAVVAVQLLAGCTAPAPRRKAAPSPLPVATCAQRLHDLSGVLLLYYALNRRLPATLEELRPFADIDRPVELTCPVSGEPYTYNPAGIPLGGTQGRAIVYDSTPAHDGVRWAITMNDPSPGTSLGTQVIPLPGNLNVPATLPSARPSP